MTTTITAPAATELDALLACHYCGRYDRELAPCCDRQEHEHQLACKDVENCRDYLLALLYDEPKAAASGLDGLLGSLLDDGHAVSFSYEPEDGYLARLDVFGDDDSVVTHDGIGRTPARALQAAAFGAGLAPDPAERPRFSDEVLAERVEALEEQADELADVRYHREILIKTLAWLSGALHAREGEAEALAGRCGELESEIATLAKRVDALED